MKMCLGKADIYKNWCKKCDLLQQALPVTSGFTKGFYKKKRIFLMILVFDKLYIYIYIAIEFFF